MQRKVLTALIGIIVLVSFSLAYAFVVSQQLSVSLSTANGLIKVYSDSGCTMQVSSISFGTVQAGSAHRKDLYVKYTATSTPGSVKLAWNSTISSVTSNQITDTWMIRLLGYYGYSLTALNGTTIDNVGSNSGNNPCYLTTYSIQVSISAPSTSYSYALNVGNQVL